MSNDSGYEIAWTPHRGFGLYATKKFEPGDRVLDERVAHAVYHNDDIAVQMKDIYLRWNDFFGEKREKFRKLHAWCEPVLASTLQTRIRELGESARARDIIEVYFIFISNHFIIEEAKRGDNGEVIPPLSGVFLEASRINHSCDPNCDWTTLYRPGHITIHATKTIDPGDELNISYLLDRTLNRDERRRELSLRWGFDCACIVCQSQQEPHEANSSRPAGELADDLDSGYRLWRGSGFNGDLPTHIPAGQQQPRPVAISLLEPNALPSVGWTQETLFMTWDVAYEAAIQHILTPRSDRTEAGHQAVVKQFENVIRLARQIYADNDPLVIDVEDILEDFVTLREVPTEDPDRIVRTGRFRNSW
ncbi:hypothetical protein F4806DRAFT_449581 [Annulohypoxylon nitens]|nr:hypothetical protein F4806DRAFT_449581 [Annulohypoxylon nitens]